MCEYEIDLARAAVVNLPCQQPSISTTIRHATSEQRGTNFKRFQILCLLVKTPESCLDCLRSADCARQRDSKHLMRTRPERVPPSSEHGSSTRLSRQRHSRLHIGVGSVHHENSPTMSQDPCEGAYDGVWGTPMDIGSFQEKRVERKTVMQ